MLFGISNCSSPKWKFCPQEDFHTELQRLKTLIENDERGKTKGFVAYASQQDGALWRQGEVTAGAKVLLSVPHVRGKQHVFSLGWTANVVWPKGVLTHGKKIFKKLSRRRQFSIQFKGVHLMEFLERQKGSDKETGCFGWLCPLHSVFVQMIVEWVTDCHLYV